MRDIQAPEQVKSQTLNDTFLPDCSRIKKMELKEETIKQLRFHGCEKQNVIADTFYFVNGILEIRADGLSTDSNFSEGALAGNLKDTR